MVLILRVLRIHILERVLALWITLINGREISLELSIDIWLRVLGEVSKLGWLSWKLLSLILRNLVHSRQILLLHRNLNWLIIHLWLVKWFLVSRVRFLLVKVELSLLF